MPDGLDPSTLPPGAEPNPTRLRILLAGLKLFGSQGYYGTSIRDIAAAAGFQSASLYDHFASKEAILTELVFIGHNAHHQVLLNALVNSEPGPREQLRSLVSGHVSAHCEYADLGPLRIRRPRPRVELRAPPPLRRGVRAGRCPA